MAGRWVFRRPPDIRRRRFVPHTFAATHVVVRRRPAQGRRRSWIRTRRPARIVAPSAFAATPAPAVRRHAWRARRRWISPRRIAPTLGGVAATSSPTLVRHTRSIRRALRRPIRRPAVVHGFEEPRVVVPSQPPITRMLRAVGRFRRAALRRLFWRPPPEIIPSHEEFFGSNKGRVFTPGLVRGRVSRGEGSA